ncbi:MAG: transcriptional regulator FilR1 domain-containing protein, partial [Halobacteriota archaeon]|nr:transcriptional regulator FilR1 domain-containing protein [Halobacteriota archaeon]
EDNNLVSKGRDGYCLTQVGMIQLMILINLIKALGTLNLQKSFWLNHQIGNIPEPLLKEMGELVESDIVKATSIDLLKPMSVIAEKISEAKMVKGVVPIFQEGFIELIEGHAMRGSEVKLILTKELFDMIKSEHKVLLRNILSKDNIEILVTDEDVKVAFAVTDSAFLLGLFRKDGTYDLSENLVSHSYEAISWGTKLFKHHLGVLNCVHASDI